MLDSASPVAPGPSPTLLGGKALSGLAHGYGSDGGDKTAPARTPSRASPSRAASPLRTASPLRSPYLSSRGSGGDSGGTDDDRVDSPLLLPLTVAAGSLLPLPPLSPPAAAAAAAPRHRPQRCFACIPQRPFDLVLNNVVMLVSEASRGVILGTLVLYVRDVSGETKDSPAARAALGNCIALFSVGRLLAGPALGAWVDVAHPALVLATALLIHCAGQVMYALASEHGGLLLLYAARLVTGFGSGTLGVNRSIAANISPPADRTAQFSYLGFSKFVGYALTPGVAVLINVDFRLAKVHIDRCTLPAWIMAALAGVLAALVAAFLDGGGTPAAEAKSSAAGASLPLLSRAATGLRRAASAAAASAAALACCRLPESVVVAALYIFVNFVTKGVLTMVETIMTADFETAQSGIVPDPIAAASELELYLGLAGLLFYAFMVLKPRSAAGAPAAVAETAAGGHLLGQPLRSPAKSERELGEPLLEVELEEVGGERALAPLVKTEAATALATVAPQRRPPPPPAPRRCGCCGGFGDACRAAWRAMGPGADPWLLIASCAISAVGAGVASPDPVADQGLPIMLAGFGLIWSVGGPVADILSASLYSVYVSKQGGRQGSAMGWITSAGSLGRITFPLLFSVLDHSLSMILSGALCIASTVALLAHYARCRRCR